MAAATSATSVGATWCDSLTAMEKDVSNTLSKFLGCNSNSYLQIVLPCDHQVLRAKATQRTTYTVSPKDLLPKEVEKRLADLVFKEVKLAGQLEM